MVDERDLASMNFEKRGILRVNATGQFHFDSQGSSKSIAPGVYLWLKRKEADRHDVMYAGKAGSGIAVRMREHIGGLRRATDDRVERIKHAFGKGNCLEVWFRESAKISCSALFAEEISAYSTEEEALITRFSPQLNRAKTPAMRSEKKETAKPVEGKMLFAALDFELANANGKQRDLWEDARAGLSESHIKKIGKVLALLSRSVQLRSRWSTLDCKVVGLYTAGPMCNQSMLVFGELAKTNFKQNSRVAYISLEKELIAFSPEVTQLMSLPPDIDGAYSLDTCLRMLAI